MGFSVSGATALLFVALLISFGTFYTATMGAMDQIQEAEVDTQEENIETLNTEIELGTAVYNTTKDPSELTITANNTGAEPLQPSKLSLLINGTFVSFGAENLTLSNPSGEDLWVPQQQLTLTFNGNDPDLPDSFDVGDTVKLVTQTEIADTVTITEVN
ncbi:hypothetical protein [Halovenus halobia]|uniref:hypothetical protein n=1 Tax=Halovenus halobia TaxID=3396622 RepID=UPI003F5700ED